MTQLVVSMKIDCFENTTHYPYRLIESNKLKNKVFVIERIFKANEP